MIELLEAAGAHAIIVVAAVEAVRARTDRIRGPWVLLLAAGCSLALAALFLTSTAAADVLHAGRVSVLAWLIAVGGDAWVGKLVAPKRTGPSFSATEAPTVDDLPRRSLR